MDTTRYLLLFIFGVLSFQYVSSFKPIETSYLFKGCNDGSIVCGSNEFSSNECTGKRDVSDYWDHEGWNDGNRFYIDTIPQENIATQISFGLIGYFCDVDANILLNGDIIANLKTNSCKSYCNDVPLVAESMHALEGLESYNYKIHNVIQIQVISGTVKLVELRTKIDHDEDTFRRSICPTAYYQNTDKDKNSDTVACIEKMTKNSVECYHPNMLFAGVQQSSTFTVETLECSSVTSTYCKVVKKTSTPTLNNDGKICIDSFGCESVTNLQPCVRIYEVKVKTASCKSVSGDILLPNKKSALEGIPCQKPNGATTGITTKALSTGIISTGITTMLLKNDGSSCTTNSECYSGYCPVEVYQCYTKKNDFQSCSNSWECKTFCAYGSCGNVCLLGNTAITMADGDTEKLLEHIEVGDIVLGTNGEPALVLHVTNETLRRNEMYGMNGGDAFFSIEHPFTVPNHPELVQGMDLEVLDAFNPKFYNKLNGYSVSPFNGSKMEVGSEIYSWNKVSKKFDISTIQEISKKKYQDSVPVHFLTTFEPSLRGGHVANGYLSQHIRDESAYYVFGLTFYIAKAISHEIDQSYNLYLKEGGLMTRRTYCYHLGLYFEDKISSKLQTNYGKFHRKVDYYNAWNSTLYSEIMSASPLLDANGHVLSSYTKKDLVRLLYTPVNTAMEWIDNDFIPSISFLIKHYRPVMQN